MIPIVLASREKLRQSPQLIDFLNASTIRGLAINRLLSRKQAPTRT